MKKTKKKLPLILVLSALPLCVIIVMFLFDKLPNDKNENRKLVNYSYNYGGDMLGSHRSAVISKKDENTALLSYSKAESHSVDPTVREYYVPVSVLDEILEIYDSYKMKRYSKLKTSPIFAYDQGSSSYSFTFEDGSHTSFNSGLIIPRKGAEGLRKISEILDEASKKSTLLPGFHPVFDADETDKDDPGCKLRLASYYRNYLSYVLSNDTDRDSELSGETVLYMISDGERRELFRDNKPMPFKLSGNSMHNDSFKLKDMRLEKGVYVLTVSGCECEFEIS